MNARDVLITGIGLVSSHGTGLDAHREALNKGEPIVDTETLAPYPVHPLGEVDWAEQISRRDMRQMEPWQRIGTFAAGLALDDAGIKGNEEIVGRTDMIVAAGGGERDVEVDSAILDEAPTVKGYAGTKREAFVAERLRNDLRPTLFLAQLSNLLAGNISIVHKVTGSSRTFMGEEGAGIAAVETSARRIESGQSEIALVGGAFSAERKDMALVFELGGYLLEGSFEPVDLRSDGLVLGSVGAFLVLESREHAKQRGAHVHARLTDARSDYGSPPERADRLANILPEAPLVMAGDPGTKGARTNANVPVRHYGTVFGHCVEAQFPLGLALAALAVEAGEAPVPFSSGEEEMTAELRKVAVTTIGHWRAEGAALVERDV